MKEREVQAIKEIEKRWKEREIQQQESLSTNGTKLNANSVTEEDCLEACLVTEGAILEACLVTKGVALEACLVTKGITMDDNLVDKESTDDSTSSEQLDECNSSMEKKDAVSSCSDSKEQHMQQLQLQARS
ncbi:hypothetical protein Tco_0108963 [Tanacetum coccineum]